MFLALATRVSSELESAHRKLIGSVPRSSRASAHLKVDPGEDKSEHLLLPHRTSFSAKLPFCPHSRIDALFQGSEGRVVRWLGHEETQNYSQHHVFPNLLFSFTDAMSLCHTIMPTSPTSSRAVVRQFGRQPVAGRGYMRPIAWLWSRLTATLNKHILKEDLTMFQSIQHGLEHSPHTGILGRCEERLHAFQQFMTTACRQSCSQPASAE